MPPMVKLGNSLLQDATGADSLWRLRDKFREEKPFGNDSVPRNHTCQSLKMVGGGRVPVETNTCTCICFPLLWGNLLLSERDTGPDHPRFDPLCLPALMALHRQMLTISAFIFFCFAQLFSS